ncbi:hypothetical protein PENTCL1PPCAC_20554, partial [Pristionchus entomophagus]
MELTDDTICVIIFAVIDCSALLANALLIAAIITRPFVGKNNLFNILNLCSSFRMQSVNGTLYFTHAGPCTLFGARFCHRSVFLQAALISHSTVLLLVSFSYRL